MFSPGASYKLKCHRDQCQGHFYSIVLVTILFAGSVRVSESFGKFWKVMEIENAIFQDQKSFRNERIFKMAFEKSWIFVWKILKNALKWM